jgi:hypothetical protein
MSRDVLSKSRQQNDDACKNRSDNFHKGNEYPERSVVTDIFILFVIEDQSKHYFEEASIKYD